MRNHDSAKVEYLVALEKWDLFFFRDKEKREVDFVVEKNKKIFWFVSESRDYDLMVLDTGKRYVVLK